MGKLNVNYARDAAKAVKAMKGGGNFVKTGAGESILRIFTFDSSVTGESAIEARIKKHYGMEGGAPICEKTLGPDGSANPTGECQYCDKVAEMEANGEEKAAKRMRAQAKCPVNCVPIVLGGVPVDSLRMSTWDMPISVFETMLGALRDPDGPIDTYFGVNGRDLRLEFDPNADVSRKYSAVAFRSAEKSAATTARLKPIAAKLLGAVKDLHAEPSLLPTWFKEGDGGTVAPEADADVVPDEAGVVPDDAPEAEADVTPEPEVEETVAPAKRTAKAAKAPEPEPEPEEDAEPPKPALPKGWEAFWSPDKKAFYFKGPGGKTTWKKPEAVAEAPAKKPAPAAAPAAKAAPAKKPVAKRK